MRSEPAERPAAARGGAIADPRALAVFFVFFAQAAAFASWLPCLPELKAAFGLSEGELVGFVAEASGLRVSFAAVASLLAAVALLSRRMPG